MGGNCLTCKLGTSCGTGSGFPYVDPKPRILNSMGEYVTTNQVWLRMQRVWFRRSEEELSLFHLGHTCKASPDNCPGIPRIMP